MSDNSDGEKQEDGVNNLDRTSTFATENELYIEHPESPESVDQDDLMYEEITMAYPGETKPQQDSTGKASENAAIQHLEALFSQGSITGSEMAMYKKRFQLLCDLLEKTRDNEFKLLQLSKKWTNKIERDKIFLAEADEYPDDSNTEVSKSRRMLLSFENEQMMLDERLSSLEYQIVKLEEEKKMLEHERDRHPRVKDRELRIRLEKSIDEMKEDISKYYSENKEMEETNKKNTERIKSITEEMEILEDKTNSLKADLVERNALPAQQVKAFEKVRKEWVEQDEILKQTEIDLEIEKKTKDELIRKLMETNEELSAKKSEFNKLQTSSYELQSQLDEIKKIFEQSKEFEKEMSQDKLKIEFDLMNLLSEKKKLHDEIKHKTKLKEKAMKSVKNAELQLKNAQEACALVKQSLDNIQSTYDITPKYDSVILESIEKRRHEIEHRKKLFEVQKTLSNVEKAKLVQSAQEEERLLYDLSDLRIEVVELTRLAQIKADEREQKAKEFIQKEKRFNSVIEELKEKNLQIQDYKKKIIETQSKLDTSAKIYTVIQNERNKFSNMIKQMTQKASEMREKLRIYNNEIEILKTNLTHKENLIQKQRTKHMELVSIRDSLRSEISKEKVQDMSLQEKRKQLQLDIKQLNQLSNEGETVQMLLRSRYDIGLRNRNDRAVQLIERNEEVCILQEKFNIKEQIIKAGDKEVHIRDDEIDFLKQNIKEMNRQIENLLKKGEEKGKLRKEIMNAKIQLAICQERQKKLELQVENPDKENRTRTLNGSDPSPVILQEKIEELEYKMAQKDEIIMEKDMLFEAVTKLAQTLENRVKSTKTDTLDLATGLNDYKSKMSQIIKKLKACTAELTMNMAESMKLQQDVNKNKNQLKQIYEKLERNEEIEIFKLPIKPQITQQIEDYEQPLYQLSNGATTTAEPRANAYIPSNSDELPIPRPYGAHAPFKPSESGSNMRHIKKQKLKPIEI